MITLFKELKDIEKGNQPHKETNKNDPILSDDDKEDMLKINGFCLYCFSYLF